MILLRSMLALLLAVTTLTACSYPIRNQPLTTAAADRYVWDNLPRGDDTLVIVTASGGGTRAAALAMSVLQAMDHIKVGPQSSLADRVDILSSVSGGSVTAAYFALDGVKGLRTLETDFIRRDGMAPLVANLLNPFSLAILATPSKERIDLLIDYLDRQLFKQATFAQLAKPAHRPYLILNAADMVEGTPFPFTQYTMDLLCSDLTTMKLSTAVAASAAFPVALSPVTLKNYCSDKKRGRAPWLRDALDTNWYTNPSRLAWARTADAYSRGDKQYIHLLDGGIADNLGVAEPYRLLVGSDVALNLRFFNSVGDGTIRKIVFVMINARSFKPSRLDKAQATPGLIDMALGSVDSSIDRATFSTAERLRELLVKQLRESSNNARDPAARANFKAAADNTFFLTVDFDAIDNRDCRRRFHSIATSWSLSDREIDALKAVGGALLMQNNQNQDAVTKMMKAIGAHLEGDIPTIDTACGLVPEPPAE